MRHRPRNSEGFDTSTQHMSSISRAIPLFEATSLTPSQKRMSNPSDATNGRLSGPAVEYDVCSAACKGGRSYFFIKGEYDPRD